MRDTAATESCIDDCDDPRVRRAARKTFELMAEPGCDVFSNLDPPARKATRASIVGLIIGTDMQFHKAKQDKAAAVPSFDLAVEAERQVCLSTAHRQRLACRGATL